MWTLRGECPAVMKGPKEFCLLFLETGEKHGEIAVVTVEIVQQYCVWRKPLDLHYYSPRFSLRVEAPVSQYAGFQRLKLCISLGTTRDSFYIAICFRTTKDIVVHAAFCEHLTDGDCDLSRAAYPTGGVDLSNC